MGTSRYIPFTGHTFSLHREVNTNSCNMGNAAARQRLKSKDFAYISKNTAFLTSCIVEEYYTELIEKCSNGKIDADLFKKIFRLAFPERPEEKLDSLIKKIQNEEKTDEQIPIHSIGMLIYLFCDGKTEDNLGQMFNLFDMDGNGTICIEELLHLMAFFIEIGMDQGSIDMSTVMAEMYNIGDKDRNDQLDKNEFVKGMINHPVTNKLMQIKTIDALLETF